MKIIKVASRKSMLALKQTQIVVDMLKKIYPNIKFEIVTIDTLGDKNLNNKLSQIGSKGLFTQEIEDMLIKGEVSMAVHSLKDIPTQLNENLQISAYIKRDTNKDIMIFAKNCSNIYDLPQNAKIGTSSIRREVQLKKISPNFEICNIRGNIQTRLKKMKEENFDAIVLAKAGLKRLDMLKDLNYQELPFISASGQGCICVETTSDNKEIISMLEKINDKTTMECVIQEREFLDYIGGGCHSPAGAYCTKKDDIYKIIGFKSDIDGTSFIYDEQISQTPENLGIDLAKKIMSKI